MRTLAILAMLPSLAYAEPVALPHFDAGVELEGGRNVTSAAFRSQVLLGVVFGSGRVRPELAAGGLFGAGDLYVADPRAVDGMLGLHAITYGPEVQLGLQLYSDGAATTRVFASLAYLHVNLDSRLAISPVPGVGGDRGERAALGVNFARTEAQGATCDKHDCNALLLVFPHQVEFVVERDAGSTRYGATLSWGI